MFASLVLTGATLFGGTDLLSAKAPASPPAYHAFAAINDFRSHGQVGDGLLSLNEAIQLHNNTLLHNQLSAAEAQQVLLIPGTGTSTFLSWARLDASSTPVITIEQDLDVIVNTTYGLFFSSDNGSTVFDFSGANLTRGMRATTNSLQMRDVTFSGGAYGIDVLQTDIAGQIGFAINNCRFENQSQFGVRIASTTPNGFGKAYFEDCVFDGSATGIIWDATVAGRTEFFDVHDCRITGATNGIEMQLGDGGTGRYTLDRIVVEASMTGIDLSRPSNATRSAQLLWRHVEVRATDCVNIDASPTAPTIVSIQMAHLRATGSSLTCGDSDDNIGGVIEDSTFFGQFILKTGGGSIPLALRNIRSSNGNHGLHSSVTQPLTVADSRFHSCTIVVHGNTPTTFTNCSLPNGILYGTAVSPVVCNESYIHPGNNPLFFTQNNPRAQDQLGSMQVIPDSPTIGSTVTLQADLPAGIFGFFLLGFTDPNPNLLPQPLHVYGNLSNMFLIPGIRRLQQTYLWPIPNFPIYIGLDMIAQIAVLPDPGVGALPVQLPPGRRFELQ